MKKNEHVLSVTALKNILKQQSRETLMKLLLDSYKAIPQVKEYITLKYANQDTIEQIFEVYKEKVYDVVFTGNMAYPPNVDAAIYLAKEIMPIVWKIFLKF